MVNWLLIILVVSGLFLFFKLNPGARYGKTWSFLIGGVILFFLITFGYVITRPEVGVDDFASFVDGIKVYFVWLKALFSQASTITGDVVSIDWDGNISSGGN